MLKEHSYFHTSKTTIIYFLQLEGGHFQGHNLDNHTSQLNNESYS